MEKTTTAPGHVPTATPEILTPEMRELAILLIKDGLQVFTTIYNHNKGAAVTYIYFTDGINIGYAQNNYFGRISFSTVHKPCKECGTGFGLNSDGIYSPTIDDAKKAFIIAPHWAKPSDIKAVKKYKNFADYSAQSLNNIGTITQIIY